MAPKRPSAERSWSTDSGISTPSLSASRRQNVRSPAAAAVEDFESVSLKEYLDFDDRPTFVTALVRDAGALRPVFVNQALKKDSKLREIITASLQKWQDHPMFTGWLVQPLASATTSEVRWSGRLWKRLVLGGKWMVVHCYGAIQDKSATGTLATSGQQRSRKASSAGAEAKSQSGATHNHVQEPREVKSPFFEPPVDWTNPSVTSPTHYVQFLRDYDWADTPLGPMKAWSWQLRSSFHTLVADPHPGLLLWGPDMSVLYNQACMQIIGDNHPAALGRDLRVAFDQPWSFVEPIIHRVRQTGRAAEHHNLYLPLMRNGHMAETYWTFTMLPIIGEDGRVVGIYDRFMETTSLKIGERRRKTLAKLGEFGSTSTTLKDLWRQFLRALEFNTQTPFAAIYSITTMDESSEGSVSSLSTSSQLKSCELEGTFGIPKDANQLPQCLDLSEADHPLAPSFRQAWRSGESVLLQKSDGTLPSCIHFTSPMRTYIDECSAVVVIPIRFAIEANLVAFVVHGLNPRRPWDEDYKGYITLLQARMTELAAGIHLPDEDRRLQANIREEAVRQASLASRLLSRTHEAEQKQHRFMRLAENAPIGMALYDAESNPIFFNDAYFKMTGQSKEKFGPFSWVEAIHEDDRDFVRKEWKKLTEDGMPVTIQHRVKEPWKSTNPYDGSEIVGEKWILSSAFPELTGDDASGPAQIMGWTIDISHQKWAEKLQRERLQDALENKRQSENFIDMTSHEMRNPLSAILQSADGINSALSAAMNVSGDFGVHEHLHAIAENSQTIILCAQHQKRIVDDILTLSKLDSNLLLITPDRTDPIAIIYHVLKMYEAELANSKIHVDLKLDPSYRDLNIRIVMLDPSRLLQVLINLLTNAIKFTQLLEHPTIVMSVSASLEKPEAGPNGVSFFPIDSSRAHSNQAKSIECFDDPVYLTFAVQDSGRGLNDEEKKMLFHRFSQANPRTHVQYGGSGLGLFISRELTELQGGQIGVSSQTGKGSTFAFYVRACRCRPKPGDKLAVDSMGADRLGLLPFTPLPLRPTGLGIGGPIGGRANSAPSGSAESGEGGGPAAGLTLLRRRSSVRDGDGLSVLIVEDNIINQNVMAKQLAQIGCMVHVANHGGEALAFIERSRAVISMDRSDSACDVSEPVEASSSSGSSKGGSAKDGEMVEDDEAAAAAARPPLNIILMDLEMPIMDGLTCVRRIRAMQRRRRILQPLPIICITANAREAQLEEAMSAGCDLVVTKPFRIPELMPQMKALIKAQQLLVRPKP